MRKLGFLLTVIALSSLACAPAEEPAEPAPPPPPPEEAVEPAPPPTAVAILQDAEGEEVGFARFVQAESAVLVTAEVGGLERQGPHGFHVHEVGECVPPDFTAAGGHFNPKGTPHACPPDAERHAGDFGNVAAAGGAATLDTSSDLITVTPGETSVVGRAVIVHNGEDDCTTQPTGDAGSRYACGVIELETEGGDEGEDDEDEGEGDGGEGDEGGDEYGP